MVLPVIRIHHRPPPWNRFPRWRWRWMTRSQPVSGSEMSVPRNRMRNSPNSFRSLVISNPNQRSSVPPAVPSSPIHMLPVLTVRNLSRVKFSVSHSSSSSSSHISRFPHFHVPKNCNPFTPLSRHQLSSAFGDFPASVPVFFANPALIIVFPALLSFGTSSRCDATHSEHRTPLQASLGREHQPDPHPGSFPGSLRTLRPCDQCPTPQGQQVWFREF